MGRPGFRLELNRNGIGQVSKSVQRRLNKVVRKTLADIEAEAKHLIEDTPKTGRIYGAESEVSFTTAGGASVGFTAHKGRQLGDDKVHQASAPGEAPATDEGNLVNSLSWRMTGPARGEFTVGAEYGAPLEFGTDDGRIAPRPFVGPSVESVGTGFVAACGTALREGAEG